MHHYIIVRSFIYSNCLNALVGVCIDSCQDDPSVRALFRYAVTLHPRGTIVNRIPRIDDRKRLVAPNNGSVWPFVVLTR
jgi:hypothetical protein